MGRRERRERWKQRRWEKLQGRLDGENQADEQARADAQMAGLRWDDNDELVEKPEDTGPDPWQQERLGTVKDVARYFQVHWKTVERWRRKDGLPCVRHGGVIRYALSDVLRWTSARKVGE